MKAFLHIGMEKTGSTSIQELLKTNTEALNEAGMAYYSGPGLRNSRDLAVYCMNADRQDDFTIGAFAGRSSSRKLWRERFKKQFEKEMKKISKNSPTVIFSSEHFHSRLTTHQELERLKSLLAPWFNEIEIILYLRRQDKVAVSFFSTMCRNGGTRKAIFKPHISADDTYYNYLGLLERWSHVFDNAKLNVRIFERDELYGADLYDDFLHALALGEEGTFNKPAIVNEKLSASVQNALLILNEQLPGAKYTPVREEFLQQVADGYPGEQKLPSRKEAEAYYNHFLDTNTIAARKFLDRETLFDSDFGDYPESHTDSPLPESLVRSLVSTITSKEQLLKSVAATHNATHLSEAADAPVVINIYTKGYVGVDREGLVRTGLSLVNQGEFLVNTKRYPSLSLSISLVSATGQTVKEFHKPLDVEMVPSESIQWNLVFEIPPGVLPKVKSIRLRATTDPASESIAHNTLLDATALLFPV